MSQNFDERTDQDGPAGPADACGAIPRPDADGTIAGHHVTWFRISPGPDDPTPSWAVFNPDRQATARTDAGAETLAGELVLDPRFYR